MAILLADFKDDVDFNLIGGKAYNLSILTRQGFPVPHGFTVTTELYRMVVEEYSDQIRAILEELDYTDLKQLDEASTQIRQIIDGLQLPDDVLNDISELLDDDSVYAVRSSATAEDLPGLSFAGQHDTFLNISPVDVPTRIIECFSSLWTTRALQYRHKNEIPHLEVANAVVVQQQILSEKSGVAFTANPVTGKRDDIVIEAIHGLGEALVSGMVEPDTYIVNEEIEVRVGNQKKIILPLIDGGTETIVNEDATRQVLDEDEIKELAAITRRIETHYGSPQDVEWAISGGEIYIIQSRAITTLFPIPNTQLPGIRLFFSINAVQGVMAPFTPLGSQIMMRFFYGLSRAFNLGGEFNQQRVIATAADRLYVDITSGLTHPLGRRAFVGFLSVAEPEMQGIIKHLLNRFPREPPRMKRMQQIFRALLFVISQVKGIYQEPDKRRKKVMKDAEKLYKQLHLEMINLTSMEEKIDYLETANTRISNFLFLSIAPFIAVTMSSLIISSRIGEAEGLGFSYLDLARSYKWNVTTEMNLYLWERTKVMREDSNTREIFESNSNAELVKLHNANKLPTVLAVELKKFLDKYGFRGYSEIDIGKPRWIDDPEPIFSHIRSYMEIKDTSHQPDVMFERGREEAESYYRRMYDHLKAQRGPSIKLRILNKLIAANRKVAGLREFPKFVWIKSFSILRKLCFDIGRELVEDQRLEDARDVFFLTFEDLRSESDLKPVVARNKKAHQEFTKIKQVPRIMLSNGETYYNAPAPAAEEGVLIGTGVSPGIVEGKARVLYEPMGAIEPGEILICPATDPSWTPLFGIASALVMEIGGAMTHGSVVAREHGIAAVVGVRECTQLIKTGQRLRVNGSSGVIEFLS